MVREVLVELRREGVVKVMGNSVVTDDSCFALSDLSDSVSSLHDV